MAENLGELQELENRMTILVTWRAQIIEQLEAAIDRANADFDEAAIPLAREINKARAALKPVRPERVRKPRREKRVKQLAGLTPEAQELYEKALAGL